MLIFTQIVILILALSVQGLVGSTNTNNAIISNLTFRYDLLSRAELATTQVSAEFKNTGNLSSDTARNTDLPTANYSSTVLPSNLDGIPEALIALPNGSNIDFQKPPLSNSTDGVLIYYVIDRLCSINSTAQQDQCTDAFSSQTANGTAGVQRPAQNFTPFFRISVLVHDPALNIKVFTQTIFSA
jgi:hypothetical protein